MIPVDNFLTNNKYTFIMCVCKRKSGVGQGCRGRGEMGVFNIAPESKAYYMSGVPGLQAQSQILLEQQQRREKRER